MLFNDEQRRQMLKIYFRNGQKVNSKCPGYVCLYANHEKKGKVNRFILHLKCGSNTELMAKTANICVPTIFSFAQPKPKRKPPKDRQLAPAIVSSEEPGAPKQKTPCRVVPAFTIQSLQKGTCVLPPPKCNALKEQPPRRSNFRTNYLRGDFPIALEANGTRISWKVDITKLDYHHYLPMFFDGLCETENPYKFFAQQGIHDMLTHGGSKIFPCIPQLILPIKNALNTKNKLVMCSSLRVIQHMVKADKMIGEALVPYYRQILPVLNLFKEKNVNCGDGIDYSQMRGENLADVINETLETLEQHGGDDAFINIKYLIPTYESCMLN